MFVPKDRAALYAGFIPVLWPSLLALSALGVQRAFALRAEPMALLARVFCFVLIEAVVALAVPSLRLKNIGVLNALSAHVVIRCIQIFIAGSAQGISAILLQTVGPRIGVRISFAARVAGGLTQVLVASKTRGRRCISERCALASPRQVKLHCVAHPVDGLWGTPVVEGSNEAFVAFS